MQATERNVEELRDYSAHPSRVRAIQYWHLEQIDSADPPVAMAAITVTAGGQIHCKGLGLDGVHAQIILEEIDILKDRIGQFVTQHGHDASASVIPLFDR